MPHTWSEANIMKISKIKLPFGLNRDGDLVHIADAAVESGKRCGFVCPSCKSQLVAAKGSKKQHHFKHDVDHECEGGLESAIHLAAKQMIIERKEIILPEFILTATKIDSKRMEYTDKETVARCRTVSFDSVQDEKELHGMKADILASVGNRHLIIEIFYSHKVDNQKREKIITANISAIEINLSDLTQEDLKDREAFWSYINEPQHIQWLHHVNTEKSKLKLETRLEKKIQLQEEKYKQKEIYKQKKEKMEQEQLSQALKDIKIISSDEHIAKLKQDAQTHSSWKYHSQFLQYSWDELPSFLNAEVPNGDWIFGCDRRIWQTAFYTFFSEKKDTDFSIEIVDDWLQNQIKLMTPHCAKIVGKYGRNYQHLVPAYILYNPPSSWNTLRFYFNYLCQLEILAFTGNYLGKSGKMDVYIRLWSKEGFQFLGQKPSTVSLLKSYVEKLKPGFIFSSDNYSTSVVIESTVAVDGQSIWVICEENETASNPWSLTKITYEDGYYVQKCIGEFSTRKCAETKYFRGLNGFDRAGSHF
ncbi:MAG: competence protein CoiA family protein [Candidatus Berkiella sp.]